MPVQQKVHRAESRVTLSTSAMPKNVPLCMKPLMPGKNLSQIEFKIHDATVRSNHQTGFSEPSQRSHRTLCLDLDKAFE